jgi:histidine triad (HIT) family protein
MALQSGGRMASDCLFCKIIAGQIPATVVYRNEQVLAIRDINPVAPTHVLLMPVRHVGSIAEAEADDADLIGRLHLAAVQIAEQEKLAGGYRLVINTGPDGGQTVGHLHLHLIGGRAMHWPPG